MRRLVKRKEKAWSELVSCSRKLRRSSAVKMCKKEHKKSSEEDAEKGQALRNREKLTKLKRYNISRMQ